MLADGINSKFLVTHLFFKFFMYMYFITFKITAIYHLLLFLPFKKESKVEMLA